MSSRTEEINKCAVNNQSEIDKTFSNSDKLSENNFDCESLGSGSKSDFYGDEHDDLIYDPNDEI